MGYMENVSEKIRELRIANNISQEKFALKIGMDRTYYSGIENGKHNISLVNAVKLAKIVDKTVDELIQEL